MKINKVGIITSGFLPVPATKGGAVENLIVNLINENEKQKKEEIVIFSIFDENAVLESQKYKYTKFIFFKATKFIKVLDKITYFFAKNILRKINSQSYRYIFQRLYFLNCVSKEIKKNNYKKIILENHPTQYLALKWRKNYKKYENRYFYHCHNEFPATYGCMEIIKKTKKIICVSEYIKKVVSNYLNMDLENFDVLRNGIDIEKFEKKSLDECLKLKEKYNITDEKIILFTGRIVQEKGVFELIKAVKRLKYEKYKLIIVGSSLNALSNKSNYELLVENEIKEIKEKIIFTGYVDYNKISVFYQVADIIVVPSIWNDPAPLTIIEAVVCNVPIITTNSGGITEYVDEQSAIVLDRDENLIENLSFNIEKIINDDNKLNLMRMACKRLSGELNMETYYNNFMKKMI